MSTTTELRPLLKRLKLGQMLNTLPERMMTDAEIDWRSIASRYELSGASILNIVHYCAIESLANPAHPFDNKRLEKAIMREFIKEGKVV